VQAMYLVSLPLSQRSSTSIEKKVKTKLTFG